MKPLCAPNPSMSLPNVLITGATSGIGKATALLFARRHPGCALVLTGRRKARLDEVCKEVEALGARVLGLNVDVTDREAMQESLGSLPDEFKDTTILVNNAGAAVGLEPLRAGNVDDWETMVKANVLGVLYTTKAVLPGMVERGDGHIVNVGSVAGSYALPNAEVYCGSKAFVNHMSLAMRGDLVGKGVRVTSVEPGNTETEFSVVRFRGDKDKADKIYEGASRRVAMTGEDIAEVIHFVSQGVGAHININRIELMPENQGFGPFSFNRT
uniref:Ketoreductase domain-containing protein n=1 Tax=Pinguiococcus pyrenoidosus TaxID=172671 RepID=A0A7R9UCN0_9STRA